MSFGAYSLGNIGYHVYRFKDCEDAYHELMTVSINVLISIMINVLRTMSWVVLYDYLQVFVDRKTNSRFLLANQ